MSHKGSLEFSKFNKLYLMASKTLEERCLMNFIGFFCGNSRRNLVAIVIKISNFVFQRRGHKVDGEYVLQNS